MGMVKMLRNHQEHGKVGSIVLRCSSAIVLFLVVDSGGAQTNTGTYEQTVIAIQEQIQRDNLGKALTLVEAAERRFPANGGLENLQGVIAIQQGNITEAEEDFSVSIRHSPRLMSPYLNLGRVYLQGSAQDSDLATKALRVYEDALKIDPKNAEANYDAAILLTRAGNYRVSLAHLAKLGTVDKFRASALAVACADEAGMGHTADAARRAASLATHSELTEADVVEIIPALFASRRADLVDVLLSAVASHQPLSAIGQHMIGLAQEAENRLPAAQDTLERAFAAGPQSSDILVDLARIAEARGDYKGALGYLAHARDLKPNDASLPYRFGLICLKMTLLAESRKALAEAVYLNPENDDYNFALGTVASFAEDPAEALPYLSKYHELRPADSGGMLALGTAYFRAKDFESAARWLRQAANVASTAPFAYYYLARIARQEGRLDEAVEALEQSIRMKPDYPDALAELGQVYVQTKQYAKADKPLNLAIRLDRDNYEANFGLLELYARTGDSRLAEQSRRFDAVKEERETKLREAMRILEVKPEIRSAK